MDIPAFWSSSIGFPMPATSCPWKGLPMTMETAEMMFNCVLHNFAGEDIVSDQGHQFISQSWKASFTLLGVTVSLSSSYHPQTNRQTDRKIQEIGRFLRTFYHSHQNSWNCFGPSMLKTLRQPASVLTPFQCVPLGTLHSGHHTVPAQ